MIEIPRALDVTAYSDDVPGSPAPSWFWWRPDAEWPGWDILLRCPHGHLATLSAGKHAIAADGTVSPSIFFKGMCAGQEEWHVHGRLVGWDPSEAAARHRVTS